MSSVRSDSSRRSSIWLHEIAVARMSFVQFCQNFKVATHPSRAYCALATLREQATRDGLTGVWNRKMIFDTLAQELARAGREGTPLAIVMVDLDKFKSINDSFGHPAGDAVLQQASRRLSACVRTYDHVGRYGGEEFLIVLPNCDGDQARKLSERLRQSVADTPMHAEGNELHITCSLGVALTDTPNGIGVAALVHAADEALYRAKQAGRNCVQLAPLPANCVSRNRRGGS
jgi:two-component system cell cycle response regulator